jgi:hypothetical protein
MFVFVPVFVVVVVVLLLLLLLLLWWWWWLLLLLLSLFLWALVEIGNHDKMSSGLEVLNAKGSAVHECFA